MDTDIKVIAGALIAALILWLLSLFGFPILLVIATWIAGACFIAIGARLIFMETSPFGLIFVGIGAWIISTMY